MGSGAKARCMGALVTPGTPSKTSSGSLSADAREAGMMRLVERWVWILANASTMAALCHLQQLHGTIRGTTWRAVWTAVLSRHSLRAARRSRDITDWRRGS
jgi:hypothetical protein